MSRHEYHRVFARESDTALAQHATNEIGLEIRLSDRGYTLYEHIYIYIYKLKAQQENENDTLQNNHTPV